MLFFYLYHVIEKLYKKIWPIFKQITFVMPFTAPDNMTFWYITYDFINTHIICIYIWNN